MSDTTTPGAGAGQGRISFAELRRRSAAKAADELIARHQQETQPPARTVAEPPSPVAMPSFDEIVSGTAGWPSLSTTTSVIDVTGALLPPEEISVDEEWPAESRVAPMGDRRPVRAEGLFGDVGVDLMPKKERSSWLARLATVILVLVLALFAGVIVYAALVWSTPDVFHELPGWVPEPIQEVLSPPR